MANPTPAPDQLLSWIAARASKPSIDESLAGVLEREFNSETPRRSPWWIVTELVNPAQTYYRLTLPHSGHDPDIDRKLQFGRFVHEQLAPRWFSQLPGYATSEGNVDGAAVGLAGVKGRLDFRVGDSIIELKTTELTLDSVAALISQSPQDLEQLVLYALLTNRDHASHLLVYYNQSLEHRFRVFRLRLTHSGPLAQHFRARMGLLETAIRDGAPGTLGRCRYFQTGCDYNIRAECGCREVTPIDTSVLLNNTVIERDEPLEGSLERIREGTTAPARTRLSLWDLFSSRQAFRDLTDPREDRPPIMDPGYALRRWYERRVYSSGLSGPSVEVLVPTSSGEPLVLGSNATLVVNETTAGGVRSSPLPYIVRLARDNKIPAADSLSPVWKGQLGARCALSGVPTGMVIVVNPVGHRQVVVFRLRFADLEGIGSRIRDRVHIILRALDQSVPDDLPLCPEWLQRLCTGVCLCRGPRPQRAA